MTAGMAEVIAAHTGNYDWDAAVTAVQGYCYCGWRASTDGFTAHAVHVAEELAKAGYGNARDALLIAAEPCPSKPSKGRTRPVCAPTAGTRQRPEGPGTRPSHPQPEGRRVRQRRMSVMGSAGTLTYSDCWGGVLYFRKRTGPPLPPSGGCSATRGLSWLHVPPA